MNTPSDNPYQKHELVLAGEVIEEGYPANPTVADQIMLRYAQQLAAGIIVPDEMLRATWDACVRRYVPPIVERYMDLRRRGICHAKITANGEKLIKPDTAHKRRVIERALGNASILAERDKGRVSRAITDVAETLGISEASVKRRRSEVLKKRREEHVSVKKTSSKK